MKKPRKVLIATKDDSFRVLDPGPADRAGIEFEYAPQRALGTLNGKALELAALVLEIDVDNPQALHEIEVLAGSMPGRKVIAATRHADSGEVRRLFRAGVADVLSFPITPEVLLNSLLDVLSPAPVATAVKAGKVITVLKAAGGVGATTLVLNAARLLSAGSGQKGALPRSTVVLDLDLQFGDTDVALNLEPRSTILDIVRAQGRFDGRFLQSVLTEHESGLRLLAPPPSLVPLDALSPAFALELVEASARAHEITVVDLPGTWADWTLPLLRRSDLVVVMAPSSVAGVAGARRVLDALQQGNVETPVFFVVSKLQGFADALERPGRIARTLEMNVDAGLAFDSQAAKAADRGRLVVDAFPHTRLSKELRSAAVKMEQKLVAYAHAQAIAAGVTP